VSNLDFSTMRAAMVASQLRTNAVSDPRVVAAMESVARERFVPADRTALAYVDVPIPLNPTRKLNAPLVTGRLLAESHLKPGLNVLLIGAATGYAAALVADLAGSVVAVEVDPSLAATAKTLHATDARITIVESPLAEGYAASAPYDAIIIDGAVEHIPASLWEQLRDGGILASGLVDQGVTRLAVGRRAGSSGSMVPFVDVEAAILPGFSLPRGFSF
jgi:protein-L-isoaspartate(D-aspartate) O-methyltransferase